MSYFDLDAIAESSPYQTTRLYCREAVQAFRAGAYRASISTLWMAVSVDIIEKIRELAGAGDKEAEAQVKAHEKLIEDNYIKGLLEFEASLLDLAEKKFEFISAFEASQLKRIKDDRHVCVHPAFDPDGVPFKFSGEVVRGHIVTANDLLFDRPPVKGRVFVDRALERVSSITFPEEVDAGERLLKSPALLGRAKDSVYRGVINSLLKKCFCQGEISLADLRRYSCAIGAIERMAPEVFKGAMVERLERTLAGVDDDVLPRFLLLCNRVPSLKERISIGLWERTLNTIPGMDASAIAGFEVEKQAAYIAEVSIKLKEAVSRLEYADKKELFTTAVSPIWMEELLDLYLSSGNFAAAETIGERGIVPHVAFLDSRLLEKLLNGTIDRQRRNNQILGAWRSEGVLQEIARKTIGLPNAHNIWLAYVSRTEQEGYELGELLQTLRELGVAIPEVVDSEILDEES